MERDTNIEEITVPVKAASSRYRMANLDYNILDGFVLVDEVDNCIITSVEDVLDENYQDGRGSESPVSWTKLEHSDLPETEIIDGSESRLRKPIKLDAQKAETILMVAHMEVIRELETGAYTLDYKCRHLLKRVVCVAKISPLTDDLSSFHKEVAIWKKLSRHLDIFAVFYESHVLDGYTCLVSENLHYTLADALRPSCPTRYTMARAQTDLDQLFAALNKLKEDRILHLDLRPDNLVVVHTGHGTKLKVTSMGESSFIEKYTKPRYTRTSGYQAPEELLQLDQGFAADMWSVGCIAVFIFTAEDLFRVNSQYEHLLHLTQLVGDIPQSMVSASPAQNKYFTMPTDGEKLLWELKSRPQFETAYGDQNLRSPWITYRDIKHITCSPKMNNRKDDPRITKDFLDLVSKMLAIDPNKRITTKKARQSNFMRTIFPEVLDSSIGLITPPPYQPHVEVIDWLPPQTKASRRPDYILGRPTIK